MTTPTPTPTPTPRPNDYLAKKNPHPRDKHIHFEEGPHKYTIRDIPGITEETEFTSVTTWVHQHFEHFDAKKVIAAMMRNTKKWNDPIANAKYYGKTAEEIEEMWSNAGKEAAAKGTEMHYNIECFYNRPPGDEEPNPNDIPHHQVDAVDTDCKLDITADSPHISAPPSLGGGTPCGPPLEYQYFLNFNNEYKSTLRPYRTEWTVFHEEARIAGSIDMVYEVIEPETDTSNATDHPVETVDSYCKLDITADHPQISPTVETVDSYCKLDITADHPQISPTVVGGRNPLRTPLAIYDWKRCREITKTNRANKYATHPAIEHLPDSNFWHYALQLNIYKYILESKYDKTIGDLYLIVLHPEAKNYQRVKLPDLQTEVSMLFDERMGWGFRPPTTVAP